jgi:hypothetical protein
MNSHIAIALAVFAVLLVPWAWGVAKRAWRARRTGTHLQPEKVVGEQLSPSGRFKVVAYSHSAGALRVQAFQRLEDEPTEAFWVQVGSSSFADPGSVAQVMSEALRAASGEVISMEAKVVPAMSGPPNNGLKPTRHG